MKIPTKMLRLYIVIYMNACREGGILDCSPVKTRI